MEATGTRAIHSPSCNSMASVLPSHRIIRRTLSAFFFAWGCADKTEGGVFICRVDHLFRTFEVPDFDRYPWVTMWTVLPAIDVRGLNAFRDHAHQNRAIGMIRTLLSCHNGNPMSAIRGEETRGHVVIGDKLQAQLDSGALIAA